MSRNRGHKPRFVCEVCESEVDIDAKSCPNCGQVFASTLCPGCGFAGEGKLFVNGCPKCGYRLGGGKNDRSNRKKRRNERNVHNSYTRELQGRKENFYFYFLAVAVFTALLAFLLLSLG